MTISEKRNRLIDQTARRPYGPEGRERYNEPRKRLRSYKIILDLLKLCKDDRYLELGCGGGLLLSRALEKAGSAAALDHSPDMVELSKENNAGALADGRLEIVQGDAADLPWTDNSLSAVSSANMFFFVDKPEAMLNEVYRVLETGGRFALVTMDNGIISKITFGWLYRLRTYSNRRMRRMLESSGFTGIEIENRLPFIQICYAVK